MLNTAKECREFAAGYKAYQREGKGREHRLMESIVDLRRAGEITNFMSGRDLFAAVVEDGDRVIREMRSRHKEGSSFAMEAGGDAITTAQFSNIIGQIAYADKLTAFENPSFIGDQLVTQIPATTGFKEMIPGVTPLGDEAENVGENEEYAKIGYGEQYIQLPEIIKNGFIMEISEEAIFEDKTGMILENFGKTVASMALTQEKERLRVALGIENTYQRNGSVQQSTYANSHVEGDFDNLIASNPLLDYTSLNAAKNAFSDLVDPDTGEPIDIGRSLQIVVPDPLEWTLATILGATGYASQPTRGSTAVQMQFANPINGGNRSYTPLSNPWVSSITGSDTSWFIGDFKGAFVERVIYQARVQTQDRTSDLSFSRDIVTRVKVSKRTRCGVREPRRVQKHTT